MAWAAKPAWGGSAAAASAERARLPKGEEGCHICGEDSFVEVKLRPCDHEICLDCANRMRNANIFRVDVGIKCPFCREYVDGFTDMNGRPDTVSDLVEANRAARKSMQARQSGADKAVSTGVPDPQRLVPSVARTSSTPAANADPSWTCSQCRFINQARHAKCARCNGDNADGSRGGGGAHKDVLTASEEEVGRYACERHHPGLARAFADAGVPWTNGSIAGTPDSIRRALRSKGHERLMRVVHMVTNGRNCERVASDVNGNYTVQNLMAAAHQLRVQALTMTQAGQPPLENFASLPSSSACTAQKAFTQLLRALVPSMHHLATSDHGVFVLVNLVKLGSPLEVAYIAEQATGGLMEWVMSKDGALFVSVLFEKLSMVALESNPSTAAKAADALTRLCTQFCAHNRVLMQCARHQHLGTPTVHVIQGALPHIDAFKMGYQLALNAPFLCQARSGSHTLEGLLQLKGVDLRCREMIRDVGCYAAKALQGQFGQLTARVDMGGPRVVRALVDLTLAEREDEWLRQITEEVIVAAASSELKGEKEGLALLAHCMALPLWSPPESQCHWAALADSSLDLGSIRQQVQAAKASQPRLPSRLHADVSEMQPTSPIEGLRRFPRYIREGATQSPRHSMLKRSGSQPGQEAPIPPPPPPPPQAAWDQPGAAQQAQQQQRGPPPGFSPAAAAAAKPAAPPGFVLPPTAAAGGSGGGAYAAGNTVVFPNGARVPMPQPYGASASSTNHSATTAQAAAAASGAASASAAAQLAAAPVPQPQPSAASSSSSTAPARSAVPPPPAQVPPPPPSLSVSAPPFVVPPPPPPQQAQQALPRQDSGLSISAGAFRPVGLNVSASPYEQHMQQMQQMQAQAEAQAAQRQAPPPVLRPTAQPFQLPSMQPQLPHQLPQQRPLMALPPHLQQQQQQQHAMAQPSSSYGSGGGMSAPATPLPLQHGAGGYLPPQQQQQQVLPPPQPTSLLPPSFRPAAAQPQQQRPAPPPAVSRQESTGSSSGPGTAPAGSDVFSGFGTLTEMLAQLTATPGPPQPAPAAAPRPAYRPAYRPTYFPPAAAAPAPAPMAAAAAQPAVLPPRPTAAPFAAPPVRVASPAERFPMPASAPAVSTGPAGGWGCKVCSYSHDGPEAEFLCCAMCGSTRI